MSARERAERRADLLRAEIAEGWRAISGVDVSVEGGEVIVEGRRLRLRSLDTGPRQARSLLGTIGDWGDYRGR